MLPTWFSSRREAEALASELGGKAFRLDLARPETFRRFTGRLASEYGRLDLLVHNASIFPRTPLASVSCAEWDAVFAANLRGPSFLTRSLLPIMSSSPEGAAICFISDAAARGLWPSYLPYCLSKIALEAYAKGLEKTLPSGVRVGVIRPGLVLPQPGFPKAQWERLRRRNTGGIRTVEGLSKAVLQFAVS